jgi:hypothetical protein
LAGFTSRLNTRSNDRPTWFYWLRSGAPTCSSTTTTAPTASDSRSPSESRQSLAVGRPNVTAAHRQLRPRHRLCGPPLNLPRTLSPMANHRTLLHQTSHLRPTLRAPRQSTAEPGQPKLPPPHRPNLLRDRASLPPIHHLGQRRPDRLGTPYRRCGRPPGGPLPAATDHGSIPIGDPLSLNPSSSSLKFAACRPRRDPFRN